jgi:hypothetical protein
MFSEKRFIVQQLAYYVHINLIKVYYLYFNDFFMKESLWPTQPSSHWVPGALTPVLKRLGCVVDLSPPSSAEDKNTWNYTSTPQFVFMAWCLIKQETRVLGVMFR